MKEKKFTFKDSLRKFDRSEICDPVHLVTASTFSVLPRQRPCFDVIRLDNWGDVVDLARNHGNHRWDLQQAQVDFGPCRVMHAAGISDWRSLKSGKLPDLSHRIITTRLKKKSADLGQRQNNFFGSRSYASLLARYDFGF